MKSTVVNMAGLKPARCVRIIFQKFQGLYTYFPPSFAKVLLEKYCQRPIYLINSFFLCKKGVPLDS